jgi:hypothetical protein
MDIADSQAPELAFEPEDIDLSTKHVQRIADLECQVKVLK